MPSPPEAPQTHHTPDADAPLLHPHIPRVEPRELADVLRKSSGPVIVDVREKGTTGGFIRGAVNVPQPDFDDEEKVDALIEKLKHETADIVFHCQHSQRRGPSAAFAFLSRLEQRLQNDETKPTVKVLHGGFHAFSQEFGNDDTLIDRSPLG
ncbi:hypothetical protein PINS_up017555 [Pythium insidiosum]|nr:hypothetical protein PINS_up017555 [Pythium insidiosum]